MKRFALLLSLLVATVHAQQPSATTITVDLFTTRIVHSVTVSPLDANASIQTCATCPQTALPSPLHLEHIRGTIHLSGNLRITRDGDGTPIEAAGIYTISPTSNGLRITVQIPSERYVAAVLSAEAATDEPAASLEALAILARTFAITNLHRHSTEHFDLCDSTHCQALRLGPVRPSIALAVRDTAGITLWRGAARASVYYTQNCGGISEAASALWPSERAPYLASHPDPYCLRRDPANWQAEIRLNDLYKIATEQHWNLPTPITAARITQRTTSGRAELLEISGPARSASLSASSLHFAVNRALGWNQIRSDFYTVTVANGMLRFKGHGYGHGVGLCQAGAFQMALEHHTTTELLSFYYPGTRIGLTSSGGLWHEEKIGAITLRSTTPDPQLTSAIQLAWQQALTLFPPTGSSPTPTIIVAPTAELFRQLTASPGYLLAVTRGDQITLQPLSTLKHYGPIEPLFRHELLHALIESQSTAKAPLWLREGLAEALADIHSPYAPAESSIAAIDQALASPQDLAAYQQTHRDAAAIVRTLGHTYSLAVMRQWLRDGVPPQVLTTLQTAH